MVGLSPSDFSPFLTNTFLHGGWLHIILNMWTLYIFGPALEDRLGPVRFAILYLVIRHCRERHACPVQCSLSSPRLAPPAPSPA